MESTLPCNYSCRQCEDSFPTDSQRKRHTRVVHQKIVKCALYKNSEQEARKYVDVERIGGVLKCPSCPSRFLDPKHLRKHSAACTPTVGESSSKRKQVLHTCALPIIDAGVEYNSRVRLLICSLCRHAINPGVDQVMRHFRRQHEIALSSDELESKLEPLEFANESALEEYSANSRKLRQVIDGIEVNQGFSCGICVYYAPQKDTMLKHFRTQHPRITPLVYGHCMVQTLFLGPRRKYFAVSNFQCSNGDGDPFNQAVSNLLKKYTEEVTHVPPADDRLVSPFLRQFRWHEVVKTHCTDDISTLISSVKFDGEDRLLKLVYPVILRYWDIGQEIIGTRTYLFERLFSSTGDDVVPASKINRIQESGKKYCQTMGALLRMVQLHAFPRYIVRNESAANIDISKKISDLSVLSSNPDEVGPNHLKLLDDVLGVIFRVNLDSENEPNEFLLFPTHRFIICKSISGVTKDSSGFVHFKPAGQITSLVAILKYWARFSALMNIHQRFWGAPPDANNDATLLRAKSLHFYLKSGNRTPFSVMQEVLSFGSSIAMAPGERRIPQVAYLSKYDRCLMDGYQVSLDNLRDLSTQLISRFQRGLYANVLMGFDTTHIQALLRSPELVFHDDYSNNKPGYSFLDDERNPWNAMRMNLVTYLLRDVCSNFIEPQSDNTIRLKREIISMWCCQVDNLTKLLVPLVYITSGQPPRASEMSATTIRNTVAGERSVYMMVDQVMLVQRYHKGQSKSGQDRLIARFLPRGITFEIMIYLTIVRPALDFFSEYLRGFQSGLRGVKASDTHYYLFCSHEQGHLDGDACRASINKAFVNCKMNISVHHYRHIAISFMERHLKIDRVRRDVLDFQAAHSSYTASTAYSRSSEDPYFMSRDDLWEFRCTSEQWHSLLHVGEASSPDNDEQRTSEVTISGRINNEASGSVVPAPDVPLVATRIEPMRDITVAIPPFSRPAIRDVMNALLPVHFATAKSQLRCFLKNPTAKFRSTEQCSAMTIILQSVSHLLVVLATNGGKSLLYQLASFCDPSRVVIVVVPLVALLIESVDKTNALGIRCCAYHQDMNPHSYCPSVLFVGVEFLEMQCFKSYILTLQEQQRISRIFFDEVHLALTATTYRRCMVHVHLLSSIAVQKTLLSATLPVEWEDKLAIVLGFEFVTIRTPTVRPSLRYRVMETVTVKQMERSCLSIVQTPLVHPDKGIIFCFTRSDVERLANILTYNTEQEFVRYHSGMNHLDRVESLKKWKSAACSYIVATSGLGQGVDYPSVRTVIHYGLTHSLIDYAQETGRAGRDKQPAECIAIYSDAYWDRFKKLIENASEKDVHALEQVKTFFLDKDHCRRQRLQEAMDGSSLPCTVSNASQSCDVCTTAQLPALEETTTSVPTHRFVAESVVANSLLQADEMVYLTFQQFFCYNKPLYCMVCWTSNPWKRVHHYPDQCPLQRRQCFKCLGDDHGSLTCPNDLRFSANSYSCYICGLPLGNILGKTSLHFGSDSGMLCATRLRGKMIPSVWAFFDCCKAKIITATGIEAQISCFTRTEFSKWLVKTPTGRVFTNLCIVGAHILEQNTAGPSLFDFN